MTFIEEITTVESQDEIQDQDDLLRILEDEIGAALALYLEIAGNLLAGSGTRLEDVPPSFFSLKYNFFSALFLFSYHRAKISKERRIFYAVVNQCLRGMVTGCDNLLDDEYKQTLPTDLPATATRFRSVLDIMASDRVLFELILKNLKGGRLTWEQGSRISSISLTALMRSGAQEAGEETGISHILSPEKVLMNIHHYKTGLLFQAPWAIPSVLEKSSPAQVEEIKKALYNIGMGCQIMDDMVDLQVDIRTHRHNYVVSVLYHSLNNASHKGVEDFWDSDDRTESSQDLLSFFPETRTAVMQTALAFLETGLTSLFSDKHRRFVEPAILFLVQRIGVPLEWMT